MTSREHARRLMLILLSSTGGPGVGPAEPGERDGEDADPAGTDAQDDAADAEDRRGRLVEALMHT